MKALTLKKFDEELQIVYGEVYAPGFPDSQDDFMTEKEVMSMAHNFMRKNRVSKVDVQHNLEESGAIVVESFIARKDDPEFLPGAWVVGVHIPDPELWKMVKSGELNGFSLHGPVMSCEREIELEIPDTIVSKTETTDGHVHTYKVKFAEDGKFLGGVAESTDGHTHDIKRGTITEIGGNPPHTHRFSYLDAIVRGV